MGMIPGTIDYNIIAYVMAGAGIIFAIIWRLYYKHPKQAKEEKK